MGITSGRGSLKQTDVHDLLRNERRQKVIEYLRASVGTTTLRELAEEIAEAETDESPPPKNIRDSVYNSLHQTHLPKLDRYGIIDYDSDRKTICLDDEVRAVDIYMGLVSPLGLTWSEFYRLYGTVSLFVVLVAHIEVPLVAAIDPLLLTTVFLGGYALSMAYQLWMQRCLYLNALID